MRKGLPGQAPMRGLPEELRGVPGIRGPAAGGKALGGSSQHRRPGALCAAEREVCKGRETTYEIGG